MPLASFYTPWRHQKISGFLMFSGGIERDQWHKIGQNRKHLMFYKTLNVSHLMFCKIRVSLRLTAQKMKFSIKDFLSKCEQIRKFFLH